MSEIQMKATINYLKRFLKNKTSTVSGIKKIRQEQIKKIKDSFNLDNIEFSYEDAEDFYSVFDSASAWILEYLTPSEFEAVVKDAIDHGDTQNEWIKRLEQFIEISGDLDLIEKSISLYDKFVKPYILKSEYDVNVSYEDDDVPF